MAQVTTNFASIIAYPLNTISRRMIMTSGTETPLYTGALDCTLKMIKIEGWRSFYKGAFMNMFRNVGSSLVLVLYDRL
jgi:solute carrier family 25 (adenine nucleotide translocator) protein 4/5/6/31